jgi:hypothetical protein
MYLLDDPRSKLQLTAGAARASTVRGARFAAAEYARFDGTTPQQSSPQATTWYSRGQNFVVSFTRATEGARLEREDQADEYMLLIPERDMPVTVQAKDDAREISGHALVIVPPGPSVITARGPATLIRIFSAAAADLNALASNAQAYAQRHPNIPPFSAWPAPTEGHRLRIYDLDVAPVPGRFGRIWRCSTLMVNIHPLEPGPRDLARLSPHHHEDFEQGSLALKGSFTHHIRWPWTPDIKDWRDDDHVACPAPSLAVIPPQAIHTSAGTDPVLNHLVDIFSPPRVDFSKMEGWVLNAEEYPMPAECAAEGPQAS